jgi:hypothetical protein
LAVYGGEWTVSDPSCFNQEKRELFSWLKHPLDMRLDGIQKQFGCKKSLGLLGDLNSISQSTK